MKATTLKTGSYFVGIASDFWRNKTHEQAREQHTGCHRHFIALPAALCSVIATFPTPDYTREAQLILDTFAALPFDHSCQISDSREGLWISGIVKRNGLVEVVSWRTANPTVPSH